MATAGPHMQKTEVSRRAEEVIGFLMAIAVVSWERLTRPLCCADGQQAWECSLHNYDTGDTYDQTPRVSDCYPPTCEVEQESAS